MASQECLADIWKQLTDLKLHKTRRGPNPRTEPEARVAFGAWASVLADVPDSKLRAHWRGWLADKRNRHQWPAPHLLLAAPARALAGPKGGQAHPGGFGPVRASTGPSRACFSEGLKAEAMRLAARWAERDGEACSFCRTHPHLRHCPVAACLRIGAA